MNFFRKNRTNPGKKMFSIIFHSSPSDVYSWHFDEYYEKFCVQKLFFKKKTYSNANSSRFSLVEIKEVKKTKTKELFEY